MFTWLKNLFKKEEVVEVKPAPVKKKRAPRKKTTKKTTKKG